MAQRRLLSMLFKVGFLLIPPKISWGAGNRVRSEKYEKKYKKIKKNLKNPLKTVDKYSAMCYNISTKRMEVDL
jgi:hypothetical protein